MEPTDRSVLTSDDEVYSHNFKDIIFANASYAIDSAFSSVTRWSEELMMPLMVESNEESSRNHSQLASRSERLATRSSGPARRVMIVALLFCTGLLVFRHRTASSSSPSSPSPSHKVNRRTAFQTCAQKLSPSLDCPTSQSCKHLESEFLNKARKIEINETSCSWATDFGLVLSLLIIRNDLSLEEPSWFMARPLNQAKDVCRWKRIDCTDPGRGVTGISLNHVGVLNGTIPSSIQGLVDLERLDMYSNPGLHGSIPTEIGKLTNLTSIKLHQSSISGSLPSQLASLKNLTELLLDGTEITGTVPDSVCKLPNLRPPHVSCYFLACSCCNCHKNAEVM